jgi:hypothetical protein
MLLAGDADDDLIEVLFIATAWRTPTDAVGKFPAKFQVPLADCFICNRDTTRRQHLFDHSQA